MDDNLFKLGIRSQTIFGAIQLVLFFISMVAVISVLQHYHANDRLTFNCSPKPSDFTKQLCYDKYTSTGSPWLIPRNVAAITFAVVLACWICFMIYGAVTLRQIRREQDEQNRKRQWKEFCCVYFVHVGFRLVFLGVMIGLFCSYQTLDLPSVFKCSSPVPQTNTTTIPVNQTETGLQCNDLHYKEKSNLNIAIIVIESSILMLGILEVIHLTLNIFKSRDQDVNEQMNLLLGNVCNVEDANNETTVTGNSSRDVNIQMNLLRGDVVFNVEDANNDRSERTAVTENSSPAVLIDEIRQLYKRREGWLPPFPWCEEFHFRLDDIYTRLKMVSRKKTEGTVTDNIVSMSDIFQPHEECQQPRTVLIEGKPGMGKTTCCKKLVYDWATRKQEAEGRFPQFETVLLLKCRDVTESADLWEAIDDQLLPQDVEEDVKQSFFNFIRHNQSNVLLLLDGLDEVPDSKLPMFSDIIQGRVLTRCRLVVTARHEAGIKARIHCDTLLEIEGFTEEDAGTFIVKYFKTKQDLAQKLLTKLRHDANLKEMAANPLNTALLCLVCEEFQGIFPENRTKLYLDMIDCVLRRYARKKGLSEDIQVYKNQLTHLGWIALKCL